MKKIFFLITMLFFLFSCSNNNSLKNEKEEYTIIITKSDSLSLSKINETQYKRWYVYYQEYDELLGTSSDSIFAFPINKKTGYFLFDKSFWVVDLPFNIKNTKNKYGLNEIIIKYFLAEKEYTLTYEDLFVTNDIRISNNDEDTKRIKNYLLTNTEPMYIIVTDEDNKEHKITVPCIPPKKKPYKE